MSKHIVTNVIGTRYKHVKIQNIASRPYIPKTLPCDNQRSTTRTERIPGNALMLREMQRLGTLDGTELTIGAVIALGVNEEIITKYRPS